MNSIAKEKINFIESLLQKMDQKKASVIDILKEEINKLKKLNDEYESFLQSKKVIHTDRNRNKTRYYLQDGSTYVVSKNCRYLYDSKTKIITYEFENGQVERTFPCGLKEIRHSDGSITIRNGTKDYESIKN
ncbi:hypothetical protein GVAV_000853 [Gurleya vavrai]